MSQGYNPHRTPAGSPDGGKFAPGDAGKDEVGQVDAFGEGHCAECGGEMFTDADGISTHIDETGNDDWEANADHVPYDDREYGEWQPHPTDDVRIADRDDPETPGSDNAIGDVTVTSKVFQHPDGDVKVEVYRWVEATTGGSPFGPSEHANAAYDQYGEDSDGTEPIDGIDYQIAEAVRVTSHKGSEVKWGSSVYGTDSPSDGLADIHETPIDWDDHYDPDDYERDIPMRLKGALDLPRYSMFTENEPEAQDWAERTAESVDVELVDGRWQVRNGDHSLDIEARGVNLGHSLYAETADARKVETTMHSDDWDDDEGYQQAVRAAYRLRDFMGADEYKRVVCGGQDSTLE